VDPRAGMNTVEKEKISEPQQSSGKPDTIPTELSRLPILRYISKVSHKISLNYLRILCFLSFVRLIHGYQAWFSDAN
jgi:hypothetical protein